MTFSCDPLDFIGRLALMVLTVVCSLILQSESTSADENPSIAIVEGAHQPALAGNVYFLKLLFHKLVWCKDLPAVSSLAMSHCRTCLHKIPEHLPGCPENPGPGYLTEIQRLSRQELTAMAIAAYDRQLGGKWPNNTAESEAFQQLDAEYNRLQSAGRYT
jgi:hypothetical protein